MRRALVVLALAAGCYEPDTADCTVTCNAGDVCAAGQICGSDGYCSAPEIAGQCPPPQVALAIAIEGDGKISIDDVGTCDSRETPSGKCSFTVTHGERLRLKASEHNDSEFVAWTTTCAGDTETCELTAVMPLTAIGAKFE